MRVPVLLVSFALSAAPAWAVTAPISGAVPLPDSLELSWPFASGESVYLLSGYSPSGGSSLHDGTNRAGFANDYYALDLTLEEHANHGKGQPVLAAGDGVVVKAGWATGGWANYGQRVIIRHEPGDGHSYVTLYAHLDRVDVQEGDTVTRGALIGALGSSCQEQLNCASFGTPHLHFAVHRDSSIGGSGTGGSYGGNAVVPELMDGAGDLRRNQAHTSANTGEPVTPPPPDPACAFDGTTELALEEDGPCARHLGPSDYWHDEAGHGGASIWTYAIAAASPDNSVRWTLSLAGPTDVELAVAVPAFATSQQARYRIEGAGVDREVVVDQQAGAGGVITLATVSASAGELSVVLADNTGEPYTGAETSKKLAFDALFARAPGSLPPEEPPAEEPPAEEPPAEEPPAEEPPAEEPPAEEPPAEGPAATNVEPLDSSLAEGCAAAPGGALGQLVLLLALARRRRR